MTHSQFQNKNLLAIDYGTKIIGLAQMIPGRDPFAYPYGRIIVQDSRQSLREIESIISEESIEIVIVGLPLLTDGNESTMTQQVRIFAKELKERLHPIPIYLQDETLTSYEAEERMKNSPRYNFKVDPKQLDAVAAAIILEDFLTSGTFCIL